MEWDRQYTNILGSESGNTPELAETYVNNTMIPDLKDLVTRYHPDVLCELCPLSRRVSDGLDRHDSCADTDGEWSYPSDHWKTKPFLAWLFNESPVKDTIAINDRWGNDCRGKHGGFYVCECKCRRSLCVYFRSLN